ncbi:MAG: hypothetical protein RR627_02740 [Niameybacter sp.]
MLEEGSDLYKRWLQHKQKGYADIITKLQTLEGNQTAERMSELQQANELIEEALKCMH